MTLRDFLNARRWHIGDLPDLTVVVRERGAPQDEDRVFGDEIAAVCAVGLELNDLGLKGGWVPFHRVLRVEGPSGAVVWTR